MSILNTRFKRFAQVIEARFSAMVWSCTASGVLTFFPLPRFAGVTSTLLIVTETRAQALEENKFLMVIFGANWCLDCRNLHRMLKGREIQDYAGDLFLFVNVDVGKFNQNADVAAELGVSLNRGIPVAIIFNTDGQVIGTTNEGQLEPARRYSSKQILKFMRDVAEHSLILAPDSVQ